MLLDRRGGAGMDVRRRAHLEPGAPVPDGRGRPAETERSVRARRAAADDPDPVAEALGAGELDGLPDRRQLERFARMDRDMEVLPPDVFEGVEVAGRREALLGAGHVEADHAGIA